MTFTYTFVVGEGTTRTAGIGMPTTVPTAPTTVPGIATPAVKPPRFPTSSANSTSSTSSLAAAFTAQANSGTFGRCSIGIFILITGLCLLALY
ncbi:hypothetical protein RSAG8_03796, partial [Rhizoctonia solani AG-8 WAC10335]